MEFRSTNVIGYSHFQGDLVTNVGSSHGVQISGGSTGGSIFPVGDDANISLTIGSKGTGALNLGSTVAGAPAALGSASTGNVTIGSTNSTVFISGSTAPFSGFLRMTDTAVATPNFATTNAMVMETTHAFAGLTTNYFLLAQPQNLSTDCLLAQVFVGSTAGEIHCRFVKVSTLAVSASTATISFLAIRMN